MKKLLFTTSLLCLTLLAVAQEYPFSVTKTGGGEQSIILIPGFASSGAVWNETVAALSNDYTCYVLTMAGFADEKPQDNPTFDHWKNEIARYIADKKIDKPIVVGHSMGGGLAMAIASAYPDLLRKIVVVDALPCLMALTQPGFEAKPDNDCSDMINRMKGMSDIDFAEMQKMNVARLTTEKSRFNDIVDWSLSTDRTTFAKMFCDFSNTDLRTEIKNIEVPALIMLEPYFKNVEDAINQQYKNLSTARIIYANQGLHFVMYDDTEWFLTNLKDFIKED